MLLCRMVIDTLAHCIFYPILLIFFNRSSSINFIFRPSMVMSFSAAKLESVRMAFEVVILDVLRSPYKGKIRLAYDF